jgi:hypothetical protein
MDCSRLLNRIGVIAAVDLCTVLPVGVERTPTAHNEEVIEMAFKAPAPLPKPKKKLLPPPPPKPKAKKKAAAPKPINADGSAAN